MTEPSASVPVSDACTLLTRRPCRTYGRGRTPPSCRTAPRLRRAGRTPCSARSRASCEHAAPAGTSRAARPPTAPAPRVCARSPSPGRTARRRKAAPRPSRLLGIPGPLTRPGLLVDPVQVAGRARDYRRGDDLRLVVAVPLEQELGQLGIPLGGQLEHDHPLLGPLDTVLPPEGARYRAGHLSACREPGPHGVVGEFHRLGA